MAVRRGLLRAVVVAVGVALAGSLMAACGGDDPQPAVKLDGSPRYPDDEGILTSVSTQRVTLDGKRSYGVSPGLRSFSAKTLAIEPMVRRENQYVQIGLRGNTMIWMAGVAAVLPTEPPTVFYVGDLVQVDKDRNLVFDEGTVFKLGPGVTPPKPRVHVQVEIDAVAHHVRAITVPGGTTGSSPPTSQP